ncbi:uncharacterized protein CLAFUR5_11773 [Fulvia fulva]|uniref:Uncharacterized protein n=1 Tax=Passalora fulva TaxID=5499 RepID=A0A9Q8PI55_PASFU|nr:uncharacterized protein CLAFUR5_11773 [Fulvia fulva]KAK4628127.1 hypothetical protein CLAFUR0_05124 [Fulvia fulva]UJO22893.1 hypothetical protein CLAFUR5_11773 [Fulvia fulva]WPV28937.1 hypothetical protein CLAFUW7_05128 [Fulvia fulva]
MASVSAPQEAKPCFVTLPQEIRDMIYEHAYQPYVQRMRGKKAITYRCPPPSLHRCSHVWNAAFPATGHAKYREILLGLEYITHYPSSESKGFVLCINGVARGCNEAQWVAKIHSQKSSSVRLIPGSAYEGWKTEKLSRDSHVHDFACEGWKRLALLLVEAVSSTSTSGSDWHGANGSSGEMMEKHRLIEEALAILIMRNKKHPRAEERLTDIRVLTIAAVSFDAALAYIDVATKMAEKCAKYQELKKELESMIAQEDV